MSARSTLMRPAPIRRPRMRRVIVALLGLFIVDAASAALAIIRGDL